MYDTPVWSRSHRVLAGTVVRAHSAQGALRLKTPGAVAALPDHNRGLMKLPARETRGRITRTEMYIWPGICFGRAATNDSSSYEGSYQRIFRERASSDVHQQRIHARQTYVAPDLRRSYKLFIMSEAIRRKYLDTLTGSGPNDCAVGCQAVCLHLPSVSVSIAGGGAASSS